MGQLLVHGKPAEVNASALDTLLGIELEAVVVKEWPGCETGVGKNAWRTDLAQHRLDLEIEPGGHTATGEGGMSKKKVEVAVVGVGSEAREDAV